MRARRRPSAGRRKEAAPRASAIEAIVAKDGPFRHVNVQKATGVPLTYPRASARRG